MLSEVLTYAYVLSEVLTYAYVLSEVLTYADVLSEAGSGPYFFGGRKSYVFRQVLSCAY